MDPINGLSLGCRIPPGVQQDAEVRFGEVEAEAPRLEADEEDRIIALLEVSDRLGAVLCAPVKVGG